MRNITRHPSPNDAARRSFAYLFACEKMCKRNKNTKTPKRFLFSVLSHIYAPQNTDACKQSRNCRKSEQNRTRKVIRCTSFNTADTVRAGW